MPRRGSHADRLLPVASCLLTFALALSVRMFWALPPETEPVAAPMKYSAEAYWDDELLARCTRHPSPAQPSTAALAHTLLAWPQVDDDAPAVAAPPTQRKPTAAAEEGEGDTLPGDFFW